jgi:murein L,D-transpeptidase YafK
MRLIFWPVLFTLSLWGYLLALVVPPLLFGAQETVTAELSGSARAEAIMAENRPSLARLMQQKGLHLGDPIFIRIFKLEEVLEVWVQKGTHFVLFKSYPICNYSGYPGPKIREGDWQSPEGFYSVGAKQLNPKSRYHLSFNIGYPNRFDVLQQRTGSAIMVHGGCSSRGCFAMTNHRIEEIYTLAHAALTTSQERFAVHVFPFRMHARNMKKFQRSPWFSFWQNLEPGYSYFETHLQVPPIEVSKGRYVIAAPMQVAMQNQTTR